jgi:hypothetical protein
MQTDCNAALFGLAPVARHGAILRLATRALDPLEDFFPNVNHLTVPDQSPHYPVES